MANTKQAVAPAQSAIVPAVTELFGKPIADVESSLVEIGFQSQKAENLMAQGEQARDVCDANLADWIRGCNYVEFKMVREFIVTGRVDAGKTVEAADKAWERQVNRMINNCNFVRPKAESKDAKRMSDKAAKQAEAMAALSNEQIEAKRAELIERGDTSAMREALALSKELDKRAKPEIDARAAGLKALRDKVIERAKDLAKAGTQDAEDKLVAALNALS